MRNLRAALRLSAPVYLILLLTGGQAYAQGQGPKIPKQLPKQINKEARKLAMKAEQAAARIGENAVYCLLAAHTDAGTGPELKAKFEALAGFPFGEFVVAVMVADLAEIPLDDVLTKRQDGLTFGEIAKEAGLDVQEMGDIHRGLADFRLDVIQAMTHPPTTDCFAP